MPSLRQIGAEIKFELLNFAKFILSMFAEWIFVWGAIIGLLIIGFMHDEWFAAIGFNDVPYGGWIIGVPFSICMLILYILVEMKLDRSDNRDEKKSRIALSTVTNFTKLSHNIELFFATLILATKTISECYRHEL